jgi:hypothetical protein
VDEFDALAAELRPHIAMPRTGQQPRACKHNINNRLLMGVLWLRRYMKAATIAQLFGVSEPVLHHELRHVIPILVVHLRYEIRWPSEAERQQLRGSLSAAMPGAVAVVDGSRQLCWNWKSHAADDYSGFVSSQNRLMQVLNCAARP